MGVALTGGAIGACGGAIDTKLTDPGSDAAGSEGGDASDEAYAHIGIGPGDAYPTIHPDGYPHIDAGTDARGAEAGADAYPHIGHLGADAFPID